MNRYKMYFDERKGKPVQVIECDLKEARRAADELANEAGRKVVLAQVSMHNARWQLEIGTFTGNRMLVDQFGDKYVMSEDYSKMEYYRKGGAS